jgi:UDP-glucuronate 4-epimerase
MERNILITGTAGFIGYHVAIKLLNDGYSVIGIDNFNDYYDVQLKEARHKQLTRYDGYTGYRQDLCDKSGLEKIFKEHDPKIICNLAAQAGVRYSLVNPGAYERSNLQGFFNLIDLAKTYNSERFVYASSSSVYGENTKVPFSESDRVDHPKSLYAATKRSNELLAYSYTKLFGMQTIGLRFFTVYGPWGRPDMALYLFADAMTQNKPIQVFNHGDMQRDFTFIDDIVHGIQKSLFVKNLEPYEIFNLGNHRAESLLDFIALIEKELGVISKKRYMGMQTGDVKATYADISRATEKLGFEPRTTIQDGVPKFINWFKRYKNI